MRGAVPSGQVGILLLVPNNIFLFTQSKYGMPTELAGAITCQMRGFLPKKYLKRTPNNPNFLSAGPLI